LVIFRKFFVVTHMYNSDFLFLKEVKIMINLHLHLLRLFPSELI
jgi:hypothetical protein